MKPDRMRASIRDAILGARDDVVALVLFGSLARGEPYHDVDVLVVVDKLDKSLLERSEDMLALSDALDLPLPAEILIYSREECKQGFEAHLPLFLNIATDGKVLFDTGFITPLVATIRDDLRRRGIKRTTTGGWRFPVRYRESVPFSLLESRDWATLWLDDAARDLAAAENLLQGHIFDKCVPHCQQTAEKAVKAVLACFGLLEQTHYVARTLARECRAHITGRWQERLLELAAQARSLEPDATLSRYPGLYRGRVWVPSREYDQARADRAVEVARLALRTAQGFVQWWFAPSTTGGKNENRP